MLSRFLKQKMPCAAVLVESLCRWLTKVEAQWVQAIVTLLIKTAPAEQETSQINVDKYMNQNLLGKRNALRWGIGDSARFLVPTRFGLWVRQKQRPLGSSILLEESCCNSEPPVGTVLAGRLRQSLLPTLILHGDSGNLQVALCRAYLKQVGGGPTEELWWPRFQADLRHCDRLNNNIFCMFLYSWMCVLQSRHRSVCQFWRIWFLSEITAQIKAFRSY